MGVTIRRCSAELNQLPARCRYPSDFRNLYTLTERSRQHLEPKITAPHVRDVCVMRAVGVGEKEGRPARVRVDLVDRYDPATGFTAMERLTGWHASIVMIRQATGRILPGAHRMEQAMTGAEVMAELERRGIAHTVEWQ